MPEKVELPPKYYLDYFHFLLNFVQKQYANILNEKELQFYEQFAQLSEDAQCLFIRFTNRRGLFFRTSRLKYAEIEDIPKSLIELSTKHFIETLSPLHIAQAGEVLGIFNKTELLNLAKLLRLTTKGKTTAKKEEVVDYLLENIDFEQFTEGVLAIEPVIKVNYEAETMMLKFLFFGNRHADMTEFVVRDLGFQRYEQFEDTTFVPHFNTRQEAEDRLWVSLIKEDFYLMKEADTEAIEIYNWFIDWNERKTDLADIAQPAFEQLVLRVAAHLERKKAYEQAFSIFQLTNQPPSRERRVRLLIKMSSPDEALKLCEEMVQSPQNADEQFFAMDFMSQQAQKSQKKRPRKSTTEWLKNSEAVTIDITWKYRVEMGVADYFNRHEQAAFFSENFLWNTLFGLLFWDIIFDAGSAAIHHPLQRSPSDMFKPTFFDKRREAMIERMELLDNQAEMLQYFEKIFVEKFGIQNPMVFWSPELLSMVMAVLHKIPADALKKVLLEMATNLRENTHGFPDLFVWSDNDYSFVEVKSPTDHLSSQQLYWLHFFERVGVKSKVLRVEWADSQLIGQENAE